MRYRTNTDRRDKDDACKNTRHLCCARSYLGATGVYDKLVDFAGAGATVPLTGFGNVLVNGTKEAIREKGLLGVLTGPLCAGSAGIAAAVLSGLVVSFLQNRKANKKHPFKG